MMVRNYVDRNGWAALPRTCRTIPFIYDAPCNNTAGVAPEVNLRNLLQAGS